MNPHQQFCHNEHCRAYGRCGEDHIMIHSQKERRYRCKRCGRTFTETKDTAFYRMHKPRWLVLGSSPKSSVVSSKKRPPSSLHERHLLALVPFAATFP